MVIETRGIILSRQRTTKALIRLRGCAVDLRLCCSQRINRFVKNLLEFHRQYNTIISTHVGANAHVIPCTICIYRCFCAGLHHQ